MLGVLGGLLLGLGGAILIQQFGLWPLDAVLLFGLPVLCIILGLVLARSAPFGSLMRRIGGFGLPVARGGDPNTAGTQTSEGERSIPGLIEDAEASGVPNAQLLGSLRGIYRVFGSIEGTDSCSGDGFVSIQGNPLTELVGQVAAGVTVVGAGMVIGSGVKKKG